MDVAFHLLMENRDEAERLDMYRKLDLNTPIRRRMEANAQRRTMNVMGLPQAGRRR